MDFTEAYAHAGSETVRFSPGSTFLAYVDGAHRSEVVVRVTGTLQVVRTWSLASALQSLAWSPDGLFLLVSAYGRQGVSFVLPLDPDAGVTDGSDDNQGWVARIAGGVAGVEHAQWVPVWRVPSVMQFTRDTGAVLYSLADQAFTAFPHTVLPKGTYQLAHTVFPHTSQEVLCLVQRERTHAALALYTPASTDAPSMDEPVTWNLHKVCGMLTQAITLHTTEPTGVAWSPDGKVVAVWDYELEYRVCLYSLAGTHLATLAIDADSDRPASEIAIAPDEARAVLAERPLSASRARRTPMRASRTGSSWQTLSTSRRTSHALSARIAGGGLGVRTVAWHPMSTFLAVGGYDARIRILSSDDWSEVFVLSMHRAALAAQHASAVVWREPRRWFEATQGQGIVSLERDELPVDPPTPRQDDSLKSGACWLEWNGEGSLLAARNEALPSTVFVYTFEGLAERSIDAHLSLHAVLILSSPIYSLAWKPDQHGTLAIVSGQSAVYLYSTQGTGEQSAEAIAIPNGASYIAHTEHFSATRLTWSPDGHTLLLADATSFCCVVPAAPLDRTMSPTKLV